MEPTSPTGDLPAHHTMPDAGPAGTRTPGKGELPFRPVTAAEFARIRTLLSECEFRTPMVQARRGSAVAEKLARPPATDGAIEPADAAEALIRLFVDGDALARADVDRLVPVELTGLLVKAGLLGEETVPDGVLRAPMALYPTGRLLIV
ncbi:MAG: hypothetical protein PVH00_06215, partial [Gemmatimonadota bacterium]